MRLDEYLTCDAATLAGLVAEKRVTAVELLDLARQRCDAVNSTINAVMPLTRVADARAADAGLSGPFAGVPFLVKDLGQEYAGSRRPTAHAPW
jgi:amidase